MNNNAMDISNLKSCISHEEATIRSFMRDPEFAAYYLQTVLQDGDADEIAEVQYWYDEAQSRRQAQAYWDNVLDNARDAVKKGQNLSEIYLRLVEAANTVKAAMV